VHALRNIHAALVPDAMLVDTQPVSAHPPVAADGTELGALDMHDWLKTIDAIDELVAVTFAAGFYEPIHQQHFTVTDTFDSGAECIDNVSCWRGTHVPAAVTASIRAARPPVTVTQDVRLRLLRRTPPPPD
jgi:hypothetical protein